MAVMSTYNYSPNTLPMSRVGGTRESELAKYQAMYPQPVAKPAVTKQPTQSSTKTTSTGTTISRPKNVISDAEKAYQENYMKQLNKLYEEGMNVLNTQQQRLQEFQPQYQQQLAATYESQIPQLQQVAESGLAKIGEQETGVKSQRESALSTARRQYEQGLQKGQQLFGGVGGSSAGQAFADIASQELLRGTGQVMTTASQNLQNLQTARRDIDMKLQADLAKLDLDKKTSLLKAQDDFRQQLDAIDSKRYELKTQKANAQLQALKDFNSRRQTLEDFYTKQQAEIDTYRQKLALSTSSSASSINQIGAGINLADITDPTSYTAAFNYLRNNPSAANYYGYLVQTDETTGEPILVQASPISRDTVETNPVTGEKQLGSRITPAGQVFKLNQPRSYGAGASF